MFEAMKHHPQKKCSTLWILVVLYVRTLKASEFKEDRFDSLIEKMEGDAREFAKELERVYQSRCDASVLSECKDANYDHCLSAFPGASCPGGTSLHNPVCGDVATCSSIYSFEASSVVLHEDLTTGKDQNPPYPQVIESVCFSRALDAYFIKKREEDKSYWKEFGYQPSAMYFGSRTGAFRHFPASRFKSCGDYDPRV